MGNALSSKASRLRLFTGLTLVALAVGGCDKCGHRVHLNAPSIQHACGDDTPSPR